MRSSHVAFSAVHFFCVVMILGVGVLFLALPHADTLRIHLINLLLSPGKASTFLGTGILTFASILLIALLLLNRRHFLRIQMKGSKIDVEEEVIRGCALDYFGKKFPGRHPLADVAIKGKSLLEIITSIPKEAEEDLLEEIEGELGELLAERFGYEKPFTLTIVSE